MQCYLKPVFNNCLKRIQILIHSAFNLLWPHKSWNYRQFKPVNRRK